MPGNSAGYGAKQLGATSLAAWKGRAGSFMAVCRCGTLCTHGVLFTIKRDTSFHGE